MCLIQAAGHQMNSKISAKDNVILVMLVDDWFKSQDIIVASGNDEWPNSDLRCKLGLRLCSESMWIRNFFFLFLQKLS